MLETLKFDSTNIVEVKKENISGFLFDFLFKDSEGNQLPITKPSDFEIKLLVQKSGSRQVESFDLNISQVIGAFVSQTTNLRVISSNNTFGAINRVPVKLPNTLLVGDDKITLEINMRSSAIAGIDVASSSATVQTMVGSGHDGIFPMVKTHNFATGDTRKEFTDFAANTTKVVLVTDETKFNHESTKGVDEVEIVTPNGTDLKRAALIAYENDLRNQGENRSFHEVLYWERVPLRNATMKVKLLEGATKEARLLSMSIVKI